jgi:cobalt-zinc-cadmium resistance protein CzcA
MNGHEVVVGTALMLIGENSRVVAQRVGDKLGPGCKDPAAGRQGGYRARPLEARQRHRSRPSSATSFEGALLVAAALFLLLGNWRRGDRGARHPVLVPDDGDRDEHRWCPGNLMSLGALDFGLIVDGAVIIIENCLRAPGAIASSTRAAAEPARAPRGDHAARARR